MSNLGKIMEIAMKNSISIEIAMKKLIPIITTIN